MRIRFVATLFLSIFFSGSLFAAHPNHKIIITDVLDDDIRALLHLLSDPSSAATIDAIITSTGNSQLKAAVAQKIVSGLGLSIPVYAGTSTDLTLNSVTAFAGRYEKEGFPLLSESEIKHLRTMRSQSGSGADKIHQILAAAGAGEHIDILCLTAPTDLVAAIKQDMGLARRVLGDMFVMGLYKQNAAGKLTSPYNTMADPHSVADLFELYNQGIFKRLVHVPSDTVQQRSGLPGGYIPADSDGVKFKSQLTLAMQKNPTLRLILMAAEEYGLNWRDSAVAEFGIGLGTDLDRWVPGSFQNPDEAARFYMADTAPTVLATMSEAELDKLAFTQRSIGVPSLDSNQIRPFTFQELKPGTRRPVLDLVEFNGLQAIQTHIARLERLPTLSNRVSPTSEVVTRTEAERATPRERATIRVKAKALVVVFKNSPDDWFALARLIASQKGRESLMNGGVICEGFETTQMGKNVKAFLNAFGMNGVFVAAGTSYKPGEVDAIPNFKGELALVREGQSSRAFSGLTVAESIGSQDIVEPSQVINRAIEWSRRNSETADAIVLGEGIDLFKYFALHTGAAEHFGNMYVMGGGRIDAASGKLVLSRNWLPHTGDVIDGFERFGQIGKRVFIFSSNEFGGSLVSSTASQAGNGAVAFSKLETAGQNNLAMRTVYDHWMNWSRVFGWVIGSKGEGYFNPNSKIDVATISPLGLFIADEWLSAKVETGRSDVQMDEISLKARLEGKTDAPITRTGIFWLKRSSGQEVTELASRFGNAVDRLVNSTEAKLFDLTVRQHSIFSEQSRASLQRMGGKIRCFDLLQGLVR